MPPDLAAAVDDAAGAPAPPAGATPRSAAWLATIVFIVVMAVTYRRAAVAVDALLVPDGVEFAAVAQRLATLGTADLSIGGAAFPSRYPPSFSGLLVPAYWVRPDDLVAGLWICRAIWSAGCATLAYGLARRLGAAAAGFCVAMLVAHPLVFDHASMLLSDAPALASLLALLGLRLARPPRSPGGFALAGAILAVGVACRSPSLCFALPLVLDLRRARRRLGSALALLGPSVAVLAANATYNRWRFGSFAMNGYAYWCPMPYARLDYVFVLSLRYVLARLAVLFGDPWVAWPFVAGSIGGAVLFARRHPLAKSLVVPLALMAAPITVLYLFYFYGIERFYLPLIAAVVLCGASAIAVAFNGSVAARGLLAAAAVGVVIWSARSVSMVAPLRDGPANVLAQMRQALPASARVVTALDPVSFESAVARGTRRRWIAATRGQEYADKAVADGPIDLDGLPRPPPLVNVVRELLARGARLAVDRTADEDAVLDELSDPSAPPAFVDAFTLARLPPLRERLQKRFLLRPLPNAPLIYRVERRANATLPVSGAGR